MSPIASEWLKLALEDAREEMAAWPEWLRGGSAEHAIGEPPATETDKQVEPRSGRSDGTECR